MRTPRIPIALFVLLLAGVDARAADPAYPTTMAGLPEQVRDLLERRYGEMADVDGPFSGWCTRAPGSFGARLLWAEVGPDAVRVRFEQQGGITGPRSRNVEFGRQDDAWVEVGQAAPPPQRLLKWTAAPRSFSSVPDQVLPPLWSPSSLPQH
ncbi:hypothetical protein LK542_18755 [Massilia sp. IC2-477]|uniref:hypothetical protein n=1 Tax=Massilia sp. IC2-477 TaxID=2887198 RepID=UPI001D10008C|nr:hypothetical protein [Massilia sp. IC2-477]MCC2957662.1 hypothetical protein [Massilia sp. IC2-477]